MCRNVAGDARIGVVAPGSPDSVGALENNERLASTSGESRGHPDAGKPRTDDHDIDVELCDSSTVRRAREVGSHPQARAFSFCGKAIRRPCGGSP
ncbi:Uncharacterised protein [Mycobacteroides abscessus subsp. abscessus]|nr:Uncharacterised protein [Mycobacteroides abscessus subsp. abscessus]